MDAQPVEQGLRCEAVRRRLQGQRVCDICQDLQRSPRWLNKWWHEYHRHPDTDFADRSRAPRTWPQQVAHETEQAIVGLRRALEAGATPSPG